MGFVGGIAAALVFRGAFLGNARVAVFGTLFAGLIFMLPALYVFRLYIDHRKSTGRKSRRAMSAVVFVNFCVYFVMMLMILFCVTVCWGVPEFGAKLPIYRQIRRGNSVHRVKGKDFLVDIT